MEDKRLTRLEFCELCVEVLIGYPIKQLQMAMDNYKAAKGILERRHREHWEGVAQSIDNAASYGD